MYQCSNVCTLTVIYFAYFHTIMNYGIIFWGKSTKGVFQLQKRLVRIMTGARSRGLCEPVFRALEILPVSPQYILSLMTYMANNMEHFSFKFSVHGINTRKKLQLHRAIANPT